MDKSLLMTISDTVDSLMLELEHIQNVMGIMEMGFKNNPFDNRDMEISSLHMLLCHIERLRVDYEEKISEILSVIIKNGNVDTDNIK